MRNASFTYSLLQCHLGEGNRKCLFGENTNSTSRLTLLPVKAAKNSTTERETGTASSARKKGNW